MNSVIVDSSIWISYFKGIPEDSKYADGLDYLLSGDEVVTNEIILTELLPAMTVRGEYTVADLLTAVRRIPLQIDWEGIRSVQEVCMKNGLNKIGIPDVIVAQQSIQTGFPLYSLDKHFRLMAEHIPLQLWP